MKFRTVCVFAALAALPAMAAGDPAKGKAVFQQCGMCHNADNPETKAGPSLKGLFKKAKMTNGLKPTDATVLSKIDQGGPTMPKYKDLLSPQEKQNLIAYLKTL